MSRDISPFPVRLSPELRTRLEDAAKSAGRSLNSEVAHRLEKSFIGISDGDGEEDDPMEKVLELTDGAGSVSELLEDRIWELLEEYPVPRDSPEALRMIRSLDMLDGKYKTFRRGVTDAFSAIRFFMLRHGPWSDSGPENLNKDKQGS